MDRRHRWQPPRTETVKLNTDGAVDTRTGNAKGGGVLRDNDGQWLGGFNRNIGRCSAFHAELWALFDGLTLGWERGLRDIEVQLHNKEDVEILQGYPHIEANGVANALARIDWNDSLVGIEDIKRSTE
ncbi:hypothetical protein F3Y22_tig00111105pilonHSYRG00441 [Hibiscus syriacus]|uniref:RNase H type-1 domain-containing protein n=1 Tax=Hibiscus syriacus TaxID=106335 RepID=A0A6A2Z008_HIBSY|nr:hypothetical protein F3Y22_tig00111105pilonHSYRG00441 [Hibiscus syriacus]